MSVDWGRKRARELMRSSRVRTRTATLVFLAAFVTLASPVDAATVTVDGSFVRILAGPGEANQLTIAPGASAPDASVTVTDTGAPLAAGSGCAQTDAGVTCVTPVDAAIDVFAGDLDDSVTVAVPAGAFVDGGGGSDLIDVANGAGDSVWCSSGRDSVTAEVLDSLALGCERVDYGPAGFVGRVRWM